MDETATRRKKIDPKLYAAGWEQEAYPHSEILTEQRAYLIAPGRVEKLSVNRHPKKADYILEYKGIKLAVIEAKRDELNVSLGVEQAKLYAQMLQIRYTYATNGDKIYFIDMGVQDAHGEYIIPSTEGFVDRFPTPDELWQMTFPEANDWRDKFNLEPFNRGGGREPRYYQVNAINNVLAAIANEQRRMLLTMATGTGKTYVAFQICWKLFQTNWNKRGDGRKPRILFISDRNILANQATNDFEQFNEDAIVRITPEMLTKRDKEVPTAQHLFFTIFQTFMSSDKSGQKYYKQYPADFFDFIIIDECHRGGANDESEWRELMEYFNDAYQLGMTATPRRSENANTYKYFGAPVYVYSLKQGIADGYLTPFRVCIAESNIDTYKYDPDDDVTGDIDPDKTYTEKDFYNGDIEMRQRDEHRVKELLKQINKNDKTIVFCCTQEHAAVIRDMINMHRDKSIGSPDYCMRVTANDGDEGEKQLKLFKNNERQIPTILTTSRKLSTGVDARNVRNIVLMRPINNMVEFKQIIGRGTRLYDEKFYFTIIDFVGANKNFQDVEWDGDPFCPICGNYPCTCSKHQPCEKCGKYPCECPKEPTFPPEPCEICGHLPCTCPGGIPKKKIRVTLSTVHELSVRTDWRDMLEMGDGKLVTIEEYIQSLFGRLPLCFDSPEALRVKWENPDSRQQLLEQLKREGFPEEKLLTLRRILCREDCDLYDILSYLAYHTTPLERAKRVEIVRRDYYIKQTQATQAFLDFLMDHYVRNGYHEFTTENLPKLINLMYGSIFDAMEKLKMTDQQIRDSYLDFQHQIYLPLGAQMGSMAFNFYNFGTYNDNSVHNSKHLTVQQ